MQTNTDQLEWKNGPFEFLRGRMVGEICKGESTLLFRCGPEFHRFDVEGDCCSYSFIWSVTPATDFKVQGFQEFEPTEEQVAGAPCPQEENKYYGCRILTDKGPVEIIYVNSSNGYYGGFITYYGVLR